MTSVWFEHSLAINVQISHLTRETISQSINRWRCGFRTQPGHSPPSDVISRKRTSPRKYSSSLRHLRVPISQRDFVVLWRADSESAWWDCHLVAHCAAPDICHHDRRGFPTTWVTAALYSLRTSRWSPEVGRQWHLVEKRRRNNYLLEI